MIEFAGLHLMDLEVGDVTGFVHSECSPDRLVQRNGYRDRDWQARASTVELRIDKLRRGSDFPAFLTPCRTAEKALTAVIHEACVHGISVRFVGDLVRAMGAEEDQPRPSLAPLRRGRRTHRDFLVRLMRATGLASGWMPPTRKFARLVASSALR
ncbi:hypothetical protein GGQ83_003349 [Roseococcus suduntuyensis]|uniref:Transposase n=1 Tax=Roseococcus suduntuyensis TaxID=455361 RepID=A0A840AG65_9PROT|nr:hypothetical protein [Roseococcus suduntuyensis]